MVADPDAIVIEPSQLDRAMWARLLGKSLDGLADASAQRLVQWAVGARSLWMDQDLIPAR